MQNIKETLFIDNVSNQEKIIVEKSFQMLYPILNETKENE
jgi:hypothetical protein